MLTSWKSLRQLEERFGASFYLLDLGAFRGNVAEFRDAFRRSYPNTSIAYSYKTNYTPSLCLAADAMGAYAEVVSRMELDFALRLGIAGARIIFNGPGKSADDIELALRHDALVNVDSSAEITAVEAVATRPSSRPFRVGIRCNFDLGGSAVSRFGFDADGDDFADAVQRLRRLPNCELVGFHCHFSTGHRSLDSYARRTRVLLDLSRRWFGEAAPKIVNVGGGFFGKMPPALAAQFPGPLPSYRQYADSIAPQVAETYPAQPHPELVLEPGAAVVADVMQFAATVIDVKTIRSRSFAMVSGSIHNIKPTLHAKTLPMRVVRSNELQQRQVHGPVDIVGYTCMEHDCLYSQYSGAIGVGDYVLFDNVGAYTTVMKPPFIRPSPPIIALESDGEVAGLARRAEQLDDVFSSYLADPGAELGSALPRHGDQARMPAGAHASKSSVDR